MMEFYAHKGRGNKKELLAEHLCETAKRAKTYADDTDLKNIAEVTALLHDAGKATADFQNVLFANECGVDHARGGAIIAYDILTSAGVSKAKAKMMATCIDGHHSSLRKPNINNFQKITNYDSFAALLTPDDSKHVPFHKEDDYDTAKREAAATVKKIDAERINNSCLVSKDEVERAMQYRILFSDLVDADWTATAAFDSDVDETTIEVNSEADEQKLADYRNRLTSKTNQMLEINKMRNTVYGACSDVSKISNPESLPYLLCAPTGTAKTLALTKAALELAKKNGRKRIFYVIPRLTIENQYVEVFRDAFGLEGIVIDNSEVELTEENRLQTERWNGKFVFTTNVKFLQTLFGSTPRQLRKLHNVENSVVVFDEAHLMIASNELTATLRAIKALMKRNVDVVLASATPIDYALRKETDWWKTVEIIEKSEREDMYRRYSGIKKTEVEYAPDKSFTYRELLTLGLEKSRQSLYICNTKPIARKLYTEAKKAAPGGHVFLLTTDDCFAHRKDILQSVSDLLKRDEPVVLVSTQCVEVGIDISFRFVARQLSPLNSIIQSAGRCGRNGEESSFLIFELNDEDIKDSDKYPHANKSYDYQDAANCAKQCLKKQLRKRGSIDLYDGGMLTEYNRRLFCAEDNKADKPELTEAINTVDFQEIERQYVVIEQKSTCNVIVPYSGNKACYALYEKIREDVHNNAEHLTKEAARNAKPITVQTFLNKAVVENCIPLLYGKEKQTNTEIDTNSKNLTRWYILENAEYYDDFGLHLNKEEISKDGSIIF